MKVGRNDDCYCGSKVKFKNCCGKDDDSNISFFQKQKSLFTKLIVVFFIGIIALFFKKFLSEDRIEMEFYKCDNPACDQWHQRPKSN